VLVLCVLALFALPARADDWGPWGECSKICDGGISTRVCTTGITANCPGVSAQICGTNACVNCTVTPYFAYGSQCSKTCGGGSYWQARQITQEPGIGGSACPQLNFTYPCNTYMCYETLYGMGFYFWGPFQGPGPLSYTVQNDNTAVDAYLFTQDNFIQYQYDVQRPKPFQTNYIAVVSTLDINTVKSEGPITLDPNTNYYLVVDHTLIGAAQGSTDGNGNIVFLENQFSYSISGLEPGPGYSSTAIMSGSPSQYAAPLAGAALAVAATTLIL